MFDSICALHYLWSIAISSRVTHEVVLSVQMPPRGKKAEKAQQPFDKATKGLKDLKHDMSADEIAAARKQLNDLEKDAGEKRKAESNMTYFLKTTGELQKGDRLTGDKRKEFLMLYLAKQAREKGTDVQLSTEKVVIHSMKTQKYDRWMSKFQMEKEFGAMKTQKWIDSGKLPKRPDPVTQEDSEDMSQWQVPEEVDVKENEDKQVVNQKTNKALNKEGDIAEAEKSLADIADNLVPGSSQKSGEGPDIKQEPEAQTNPLDALGIMKDTRGILRKLRDIEMEAKLIRDGSTSMAYAKNLHTDLVAYLPKLASTIKAVEKLMLASSSEVLNVDEMKRLDTKVCALMERFDEMHGWAVKFGLAKQAKRARR